MGAALGARADALERQVALLTVAMITTCYLLPATCYLCYLLPTTCYLPTTYSLTARARAAADPSRGGAAEGG